MSETGEGKAKRDVVASGAKPRLEVRVRERRQRPTRTDGGLAALCKEVARRRAIAAADTAMHRRRDGSREAAK